MIKNLFKNMIGPSCRQKGQALIEAILGLAFAVVVVTAVVIAVINAVNNSTFNKNQNSSSQYAQEGIDIARNMKESSPQAFFSLNGNYCADTLTRSLSGSGNCTVGIFSRTVSVEASSSRCASGGSYVISSVSWNDSKCQGSTFCHRVRIDSCFYDLTLLPNP